MFAVKFVSEKGRPVERPLYAKVIYPNRRGLGRTKGWKLSDTTEDATTWATREAAERTAAHFSRHPDLYAFEAVEV